MMAHIGKRGAMAVFSIPNIGDVIRSHAAHTPAHHHRARGCMHTAAALAWRTPCPPKADTKPGQAEHSPQPGYSLAHKFPAAPPLAPCIPTCSTWNGLVLTHHLNGPSHAALLEMEGAWEGGNASLPKSCRANHSK